MPQLPQKGKKEMTKEKISLIKALALLNCALADLEGMIDIADPDNDEDNRHPGRATIEEIKIFLEYQRSLIEYRPASTMLSLPFDQTDNN